MLATHLKYLVSAELGELTLVSVSPTGTGVSITANLEALYNRAIELTTAPGHLVVSNLTGVVLDVDLASPSGASVTLPGNRLRVDPDDPLDYYTRFMVTLAPDSVQAVTAPDQTNLAIEPGAWVFTTEDDPENPHTPGEYDLAILSYSPTGAGVSVLADLSVTFGASVLLGTSPQLTIFDRDGVFAAVDLTNPAPHVLEVSGATATLHVYGGFEVTTTYNVTLTEGAFEDASADIHRAIDVGEWLFTTNDVPNPDDVDDPVDPIEPPEDPADFWQEAQFLRTTTYQYSKHLSVSGNGLTIAYGLGTASSGQCTIWDWDEETSSFALTQELGSIDTAYLYNVRTWLSPDGLRLVVAAGRTYQYTAITISFFKRGAIGDTFTLDRKVTESNCTWVDISATQIGDRLVAIIYRNSSAKRFFRIFTYDYGAETWDDTVTTADLSALSTYEFGSMATIGTSVVWSDSWWSWLFPSYVYHHDVVIGTTADTLQYWRITDDGDCGIIDTEADFDLRGIAGNGAYLMTASEAAGSEPERVELLHVSQTAASNNLTSWPGHSYEETIGGTSAQYPSVAFSRMTACYHLMGATDITTKTSAGDTVGTIDLTGMYRVVSLHFIAASDDGTTVVTRTIDGNSGAIYAMRRLGA